MKPKISEQIAAFEARRAQSAARMAELMDIAGDAGATLDQGQQEEFDTLERDIAEIDGHIRRLKTVQGELVRGATAVTGANANTQERAAQLRAVAGGAAAVERASVITVHSNLPKGTAFARYALALARSKGNLSVAERIAQQWRDTTPEVEVILRAAADAGTTTDPAWAAPLTPYRPMANEFIELLRPATIIGRIPGFRRVPFNISMPSQTAASSASWVGEAQPKPVSGLAFETVTLRWAKAAGIVVITDELARFSEPSAEAIVQDDLVKTITEFLDRQFVDPDVAEVPNVSPASITHGASVVQASGEYEDNVRQDVRDLFSLFINANLSIAGAVWIMDPVTALTLSMMRNAFGQSVFPTIDQNGGSWFGLPVITSENIPAGTSGTRIILAKPSEILMADDGGVALDVSREASLQMDSAPSGDGTNLISLWQQNMIGLRAERFINWKRRRDAAVAYIDNANYGFLVPGTT